MKTAQQIDHDYIALTMLRDAFKSLGDEQLASGAAVLALIVAIGNCQHGKVSIGFSEVNAVIQDMHLKRCLERYGHGSTQG